VIIVIDRTASLNVRPPEAQCASRLAEDLFGKSTRPSVTLITTIGNATTIFFTGGLAPVGTVAGVAAISNAAAPFFAGRLAPIAAVTLITAISNATASFFASALATTSGHMKDWGNLNSV
jgi:hypothetical protein